MKKSSQLIFIFALLFCHCNSYAAKQLSVMTFNIENGGTQVSFNKVIEVIRKSQADVVGIQESEGNIPKLAKALGFNYYSEKQQVISRYPLIEDKDHAKNYLFVEVEPGKVVVISNVHLPDEPYGPDLVRKKVSVRDVIQNENKVRLPSILKVVSELHHFVQKGIPVFLTGDFNSPSHLDWTQATVNRISNHHYAVEWPVSRLLQEKGLIDSYRNQFPNPIAFKGTTWPAARPFLKNSVDHYNPSVADLPDRIDFIYTGGRSRVLASHIIGEIGNAQSKVVLPWPSDHRALVSRFEVEPYAMPLQGLTRANNV